MMSKFSLSLVISISIMMQLFFYPVPSSADQSWVSRWIKNQKLNKESISYKSLFAQVSSDLDDRDRVILGNLVTQYGDVVIPKLHHQIVKNNNGSIVDQIKLSQGSESVIVEVLNNNSDDLLIKIISSQKGNPLQFRIYPERISVQEMAMFLKKADQKFKNELFDPTPGLRLLSPKHLEKLTSHQKKTYFKAVQEVLIAAQKVSALRVSPKKGAGLFDMIISNAVAEDMNNCIVGGWSGHLRNGTCEISGVNHKCPSDPNRVLCNPMFFGESTQCTSFSEAANCPVNGDWNSAMRAISRSGDNFDEVKLKLKGSIGNLIDQCETGFAYFKPMKSNFFIEEAFAAGPDGRSDGGVLPPGGKGLEVVAPKTNSSLPVSEVSNPSKVIQVGAGHCQELKERLRSLDRLTCQDLDTKLRNDLGCGEPAIIPVALANTPEKVVSSQKQTNSIWPLLIGAGLLGFLLGYLIKKSKTVTQLVPNPIPGNPIMVPNPIPGNPILVPNPIPGNPVLVPKPIPTPVPGNPVVIPNPIPIPVPNPIPNPIPVPGPNYTPPVR